MTARPAALLLAPGAGGDRTHPAFVAIERAVKAPPLGLAVRRMDFPYRKAGRKAPDKEPVAIAEVLREARGLVKRAGADPGALVLGGRSYGGRMCSLAVAQGLPAAGLVLLSYPLHPPGRRDRMRVEHFAQLDLPVLFVTGDADPFGTRAEFARQTKKIRGPVTRVWVKGGHDPKGQDDAIASAVKEWLTNLSAR